MDGKKTSVPAQPRMAAAPGIVIRGGFEPVGRPKVSAFIWGGKIRPVPAIPYGRRSA